jgi:hypothetical protein
MPGVEPLSAQCCRLILILIQRLELCHGPFALAPRLPLRLSIFFTIAGVTPGELALELPCRPAGRALILLLADCNCFRLLI